MKFAIKSRKGAAASLAFLLSAPVVLLTGVGGGVAQASSETFHLFGQVNNNSLSGAQDLGTGRNVAMTVSPASPAANGAIEVQVTSSNLTLCSGPASPIAANSEELDAVISLDGTTYVLRGPQNTAAVPASPANNSLAPNCAYSVVNPGWVVSSTAGNSSGTSLNNLTLAPTTSGTYTLGLKVNGTSFTTAAIAFDANANTIKTAITTAATTAGVTGVSFAVFGNVASANRLVMAYTNPTGASTGSPYLTADGYVATALPTLEATNATSNATLATTTAVATTTGIGATTFTQADGSVSAGVALKAPTTPGDYEIKLKALALNSLGTSTGLYDNFDELINIDSNGACFNSAGCAGTAGPGGATNDGAGAGTGSFYNDNASKYITFGTPVSISVAGLSKPATPAKPTAVAGDTKATVSWTAPGDGGSAILSYEVTSSPEGKTCAPASLTPPLTCDVTGLTNGTPYTFSVTATNDQGASNASVASDAVTPFAPTKPATPAAPTAVAGNAQATVTWTVPASTGSTILSYEVTSSPEGKTCAPASLTPPLTCDVTGLTNGTPYTFTVVATNGKGASDASSASNSVTPSAPTKSSPPTNVTVLAGDGKLTVSWTAPTDTGGSDILSYTATAATYTAPASRGKGRVTAQVVDLTCTTTDTTTCDITQGVTNGTAYTVTVVATNGVGASDASAQSQPATPTAAISTAPRTVQSTIAKVYCQPNNVGLQPTPDKFSNWPVSITVDPGAAAPSSTVKVSVSVNASPTDGPAVPLVVGQYQMQAQVLINGKSYLLDGPKNGTNVLPTKPIFVASELPTVAKGVVTIPATEGEFDITIKQLVYTNVISRDGSPTLKVPAGEINAGEAIFTEKCNASATSPAEDPQAFNAPKVSVTSSNAAPSNTATPDPTDTTGGNGDGTDTSGGTLPKTGGNPISTLVLAIGLFQIGLILAVRSIRATPRPARLT